MHTLLERLESFDSPRIALLGDFMLDRWIYGNTERLSQEAPVPILRKVREKALTGGAGNVAQAVIALGARVTCIGVTGQDQDGNELGRLLSASGAETSYLIKLKNRVTTVKTRYVGLAQHRIAQQMFRVDAEETESIPDRAMVSLKAAVRSEIASCRVLALEDYDKGIFGNLHTPEIIAIARKAGRVVVVDPALINDYRRYRGATILTPNRFEAQLASGINITDDASLERAARQILLTAEADAVAVTLDKEGIYLLPRDGEGKLIPSRKPRSIYDVSGAGDEVIAVLAVALAGECSYE
ncbi:MAG: hypothetical protein J7M14_02220 [Planctomycetes bacterium]|nr:hypothetical protein [Planctomycetota bacterium]